jgi:multiple sugar transport system substrate-binding protein
MNTAYPDRRRTMACTRNLRSRLLSCAAAALIAAPIAATGGPASAQTAEGEQSIVFWSREGNPERVARTQKNIEVFKDKTGIDVELVVVDETALFTLILVNAAAGTLPDVVHHPAALTSRWVKEGLLNPDAAAEVLAELGEETFYPAALRAVEVDGQYAAIPIDGQGPVVHYRTDWFEEAGLPPPRTYDEMLAAAAALHDPANQRYGISLSTDPGNEAMQTRLESMALANGCYLVDDSGEADFDSPNCLEFLEFEKELRQYAPEGLFDSVASRAVYLAGQAAMYIGGTATLHRMAGLDDSQLATCAECTENPAYLAENTALIPAWSGPSGEPVQLGSLITVGISADAKVEPAQEFVRYLLSDGYTEWLAQAPNILLPARPGTKEDPEHFLKEWRKLEIGVERRGLLDDFYEPEVIDELLEGAPKKFDSWALRDPALTGAAYEALLVPQVVAEMHEGALTPQEAAERINEELTILLEDLDG